MINLDERFHDYLGGRKTFRIDGVEEPLKGYGYNCDGNDIVGYYVTTTHYKLFYNLNEQFIRMVPLNDLDNTITVSSPPIEL